MNRYERERYEELHAWQEEPPPPVARLMGRAAGPASRAVQAMLPEEALQMVMDAAFSLSVRMDGEARLARRAGVAEITDLRESALADCDRLARHAQRRAALAGAGTGAAFGMAGAAGLVADVPTLAVLALRTIRRIGLCYGERLDGTSGRRLSMAIFALASANSVEEKQQALRVLGTAEQDDESSNAAWRDGLERAAERELAKDAATASLSNLAAQLTRHLGWRKASAAVPVIGAVIGGSVNAWYLHDVARVARYCFQHRWLQRRQHKPLTALPRKGRRSTVKADDSPAV